jgi:apolipoprotein N-acyltransferase
MNKYLITGLSVTGGILAGLAWSGWCSGLILLVAFVPFFIIEDYLFENKWNFTPNAFFLFLLPGFVVFSILALGWMRVASIIGAICVIMGLSFLMSFSLWLAHVVRLRTGNIPGFISLFAFWMTYEFISLNVNIVSPWLNLGNGLAKDLLFVQWYEITGTSGGTLWILSSNLLLSVIIMRWLTEKKSNFLYLVLWLFVLIIPASLSVYRYKTIRQSYAHSQEVVIVQPNIDPYTQKFTIPFSDQLKIVSGLVKTEITDRTDWVITPETTIDDPENLNDFKNDKYISAVKDLIQPYPNVNVIMGLVTYKLYPPSMEAPTISARILKKDGQYYDHFNSAVQIDSGNSFSVYHKSKLVPGIEMQFSNGPGRLLSHILPNLGGTKWGYGTQDIRTVFKHTTNSVKIAPVICYESVFGKFVTGYIRNGAEAIFIITNDGWWKGTNGYEQHLSFASLRAIETRRPVIRSANTGVSCIIDITGERTIETGWWTQDVIKGEYFPETTITPYVKYGDWLLVLSVFVTVILVFAVFIALPVIKKYSHSK